MIAKKIVIVGDSILDRFVFCRKLPSKNESNAPIMRTEHTQDSPGGAANVALQLASLVGRVSFISIFGDDPESQIIKNLLLQRAPSMRVKGPVAENKTVTKYRIVEPSFGQLMRVDCENPEAVPIKAKIDVVTETEGELDTGTILVISDYEKGCLSYQTCRSLISSATRMGCIVLVDGKCAEPKKYAGAFLIKPNRVELAAMTGLPTGSLEEALLASKKLLQITGSTWVFVTMDKDGMLLVGEKSARHIPTKVFYAGGTVGAGDTVIAHIAANLYKGIPIENACLQASASISSKLMQLNNMPGPQSPPTSREDKIVSILQLETILSQIRRNRKVVFTNGCFDILHAGHIFCLESAAKHGDILVVGINDDNSAHRCKGRGRPVNPLADRMCVLSALNCVNFVVPFSEDTPMNLIERVHPDVLIKGGDYVGKEVIGSEFVTSYGGEVILTGYDDRHSTTNIIANIGGTVR